jgi:hypothetical protein
VEQTPPRRVGEEEAALQEEEWAHGVDRRENGPHGVQRGALDAVEGVHHHGVRQREALRLAHEEVEHDVASVRGADEAGEVAQLDFVAHATRAAQHGGEGPAVDVGEGDDALVQEVAVVAVPHEAAAAGGPQRHSRHSDLPSRVVAERHDRVEEQARDRPRIQRPRRRRLR